MSAEAVQFPWWVEPGAMVVVATWFLDKVHRAWARHRDRVKGVEAEKKALEEAQADALTVSQAECKARRREVQTGWEDHCGQCKEDTEGRFSDGDDEFLWLRAGLGLLCRQAGVGADAIQAEMDMLRSRRKAKHE